jgi:hypothetical protein
MYFRQFVIALLVFGSFAFDQAEAQERYRVYLGTYTGKDSQGIYQCELNLKDGSLSKATLAGESSSPSFLAIHFYMPSMNPTRPSVPLRSMTRRAT